VKEYTLKLHNEDQALVSDAVTGAVSAVEEEAEDVAEDAQVEENGLTLLVQEIIDSEKVSEAEFKTTVNSLTKGVAQAQANVVEVDNACKTSISGAEQKVNENTAARGDAEETALNAGETLGHAQEDLANEKTKCADAMGEAFSTAVGEYQSDLDALKSATAVLNSKLGGKK
jgi:hypothetical protein